MGTIKAWRFFVGLGASSVVSGFCLFAGMSSPDLPTQWTTDKKLLGSALIAFLSFMFGLTVASFPTINKEEKS